MPPPEGKALLVGAGPGAAEKIAPFKRTPGAG